MDADAVEETAELDEQVDLEPFAAVTELLRIATVRPPSSAFIAAEEQPVLSSEGDSPEASLGAVVANVRVSSLAALEERLAVYLTDRIHLSRSTDP